MQMATVQQGQVLRFRCSMVLRFTCSMVCIFMCSRPHRFRFRGINRFLVSSPTFSMFQGFFRFHHRHPPSQCMFLSVKVLSHGSLHKKKNAFEHLRQGTRTVRQYERKFSRLCRFVGYVDKPGDPALRILPYGYGPVYVVGVLVAGGEIGR
ncbi:hypothetical protein DY000_02022173 [Brassica cretica]|uniref:Retrotransposon gag domain-containing protein n=1 Tax=Brassica cretica TaxID=69181 RepID=A0ABQ7EIL9_BRACR|nr:hypothetical protein DY000_02022173 [Brassica cretica]